MKNQSGAIKTNLELYRVVMGGSGGYRRLTGGSDDFSLQTDTHTLHHNIYIIIIVIIVIIITIIVIIIIVIIIITRQYQAFSQLSLELIHGPLHSLGVYIWDSFNVLLHVSDTQLVKHITRQSKDKT